MSLSGQESQQPCQTTSARMEVQDHDHALDCLTAEFGNDFADLAELSYPSFE